VSTPSAVIAPQQEKRRVHRAGANRLLHLPRIHRIRTSWGGAVIETIVAYRAAPNRRPTATLLSRSIAW
jgi:hypothetical protein